MTTDTGRTSREDAEGLLAVCRNKLFVTPEDRWARGIRKQTGNLIRDYIALLDEVERYQARIAELEEALVVARTELVEYADQDDLEAYLHDGGLRAQPHESIAPALNRIDTALASASDAPRAGEGE